MKLKYMTVCVVAVCLAASFPACSSPDDPSGGNDMPENGGSTGGDNTGGGTENGGGTEDPGTDTSTWQLIFEDDFESDNSSTPDPEKWVLAEKGSDSWNRYLSESYDQAYINEGSLHLIAEQIDGQYLTGAIETRGKFDFEHGKVECRARFLRQPKGNHTGIWMMPAPPTEQWPKSGEIDIMEHLGSDDIVYQTVHTWYADDLGHNTDPKPQGTAQIDNSDWNTYGLIWTSDSITFTINGENYLSYPNLNLGGQDGAYQWPFNHSFYLILSQSLGGEGTWAGPIDNSELPAEFVIDWIKVWQPADE